MQRFEKAIATACLGLALLAPAQAGPIISFTCSKEPGESCTYKPVIDGVGGYQVTCANSDAQPAPEVSVSGKGPVTECTIKTVPDRYTAVGCTALGIPSDPDQIQIEATCKAK